MFWMPGASYRGTLPPLTEREISVRDFLRQHVETLAGRIGERNALHYDRLTAAADFLDASLGGAGFEVRRQRYEAGGKPFDNLEVEIRGASRPDEIVVVGAHYDSVPGAPGANDNATGAAAVVALARMFGGTRPARTLRFVEFVNEERPFAHTPDMGSVVYAKRSRERGERIVAMLSLETIGYYTDQPGSQQYPSPLNWIYPSTGNFIAVVGNLASRRLVRRTIAAFRRGTTFPSEGGALPERLPGVGWSDHWSFWQAGYPAAMVTDTALFRDPSYHTAADTPNTIDYSRLARVVVGLEHVVAELAE
ncbi:MAG: M28 family peptidase [Nitrospirae bacterium]|nr:M28 family peptidase [Nitrospirota bacterium]